MPTLASELRNKLERVVIDARDAAEIGARAALEALAVHHHAAYPHMKPAQIELRNTSAPVRGNSGIGNCPSQTPGAKTSILIT